MGIRKTSWIASTLVVISILSLVVSVAGGNVHPIESDRIGVAGCSNTSDFLAPYPTYSATDTLWYQNLAMSGGTLPVWADVNGEGVTYWSNFQANLEEFGARAVWYQICLRQRSTSPTGMTLGQQADLEAVLTQIRALTSSRTDIYVSPLNSYIENSCPATGPYGVSNSIELANWASTEGLALRGPDLGPLAPDMVASDLCHPNALGAALGARQLAAFFDTREPSPEPTPAYWCVDGKSLLSTGTPPGGYVAGPYSTKTEASLDPGCVVPRISTSTNPIFTGQPVVLTDFYSGTHLRRWSFGDGLTMRGDSQAVTYTYSTPGTYLIMLETTDEFGERVTLTREIAVLP